MRMTEAVFLYLYVPALNSIYVRLRIIRWRRLCSCFCIQHWMSGGVDFVPDVYAYKLQGTGTEEPLEDLVQGDRGVSIVPHEFVVNKVLEAI